MRSSFFNSCDYDREYDSADFAEYFGTLVGNGVFADPANGMQVYFKSGMQIGIRAGSCYINGYAGYADGTDTVTLGYGGTSVYRYDAIVARLDLAENARNITIAKIIGNDASSMENAVKPSPVRSGTKYDIVLAYIAVGAGVSSISSAVIEDTRQNAAVCGIVSGLVNNIDTTDLFAQYDAQWELLKAGCAKDSAAVIKAWSALNALKTINGTEPTNGNIVLTQGLIPSGDNAYQMPYYIQSGTVTVTSSIRNGTSITFPKAFKSTPLLALTASFNLVSGGGNNPAPQVLGYGNLTATGFTLYPFGFSTSGEKYLANAMTGTARWFAMGKV